MDNDQNHNLGILFWITLMRGFLVIILGLSIIFVPEKTKAMLFNFMGFFWLMTGIVSIRQEFHNRGHRLVLAAGILGILAGVAVETRNLTREYLDEFWVMELLGAVILLTGILHILGGLQIGGRAMRGRTELSIMLGVIEVILGGVLMLFQGGPSPILYGFTIIWALLGGILLLGDAFRQYRQRKSGG
jgi:uncharacterized membrane protein HdeD (DUF308 family)